MAVKNTIAIIASTEEKAAAIVSKLSVKNYRLLLVEKQQHQFAELCHAIQKEYPGMEVEVMNCMKDSCWEADVIILDIPPVDDEAVAEMIKDVATQKVIINFLKDQHSLIHKNDLQLLLKHSRVVNVFNKSDSVKILGTGIDDNTVLFVSDLLNRKSENVTGINNLL